MGFALVAAQGMDWLFYYAVEHGPASFFVPLGVVLWFAVYLFTLRRLL